MAQTLPHSQSQIVRQLLIDLGRGTDPDDDGAWPIFATNEPDTPDEEVTVIDTEGTDQGRLMDTGENLGPNGIQIRIRAKTHDAGHLKADEIYTCLCEEVYDNEVTVGATDYLVNCFVRIRDILYLGRGVPATQRHHFSINAEVHIDKL